MTIRLGRKIRCMVLVCGALGMGCAVSLAQFLGPAVTAPPKPSSVPDSALNADYGELKIAPGDVIGMGSKVGAKVTLRVSGMAVAEGELVDVEGELGVRIRRRLGDK